MKPLLALALSLAAMGAQGAEVGVHTFSVHAPQRAQRNDNLGVFVAADGWRAGIYRNSHDRTSVYAAKSFDLISGRYGSLSAGLGLASGYQRKCEDRYVKTGEHKTVQKYQNGDTSTTTYPVWEKRESCTGFSRGALTPVGALTYSAPFAFMGATPEVSVMPGFGKTSTVGHLSFKWSIQ